MACPAMPTCGLAVTEAERALPTIMDELEVELAKLGLERRAIHGPDDRLPQRLRPSLQRRHRPRRPLGDPQPRRHPRPGHLHDLPRRPDPGDRLNVEFKDYVPFDRVVAELVPVFGRFKAERLAGETFGDFCHRVGVEELAGEPTPT